MNSYKILVPVGEGSFGRVYKARKRFDGQIVALKFVSKVGCSEMQLQTLRREIEILRGLQHPNIVQLFDSFETETELVLVTEYAEAALYEIIMDDGNLPESQVRKIACQLVSALHYLHSHRILHRDIKPQNILVSENGVVKLCDFGFATTMSNSTLMLNSLKGTVLYMAPELVKKKMYNHTADLWSLGCVLYVLHTGVPPFYTDSFYHLVRMIVRDEINWPSTMSDDCMSFLKGLLTKDHKNRLSWPDLLHHPFVADGVLDVFTPHPDMTAPKLQQVAEKTMQTPGGNRILRNAREQADTSTRGKPVGSDGVKQRKDGVGIERATSVTAAEPCSSHISGTAGHSAMTDANHSLSPKSQASWRSNHRSQISLDYEQEFPSVVIGPGLVKRCSEDRQNVDSEEYWEKLAQESDPSRQQSEPLNYSAIIVQLKSKILALKAQLTGGVKEAWRIHLPVKVLHNLIVTSDLEKLHHIDGELGLPQVLFDLVRDAVDNSDLIQQPWSVSALGEVIVVLMMHWEKHWDWAKEEHRLEDFTKPFTTILSQPNLIALAPLAASALSLITQYDAHINVDMDDLTYVITNLLDSSEPRLSLPPGWGLCDGLLSLLLHTLYEHDNGSGPSCLNPVMFLDLWGKIGSSLTRTTPETDFCSQNGLHSFLSTALFVFTKDPYSCIPLFAEPEYKCVYTLGRLLGADCLSLFGESDVGRQEVDVSYHNLSALSCHLLCFPFALDLPSHSMSAILQVYDSCGIVASLLQVIQTLPPQLLELPLSLLSRLLLCDPERSVSHLGKAACVFFAPPGDSQLATSKHHTPLGRTANSLLSDLLQLDSAVELLTLLSQIARYSPQPAHLQLHLEASVLHQALAHSDDQIRAATCRLLGNVDPFRPLTLHTLQLDIFKIMLDRLHDSCMAVRRMACRAVGNWLGYIAAGFKMGRSSVNGSDTTGWSKTETHNSAGDFEMILVQGEDDEERSRWRKEARRTAAMLLSVITDPDPRTRHHCCAALGNLVHIDDAVSVLLGENVSNLLLRDVYMDSHNAVRQAAMATLSLYSQQDVRSLDVGEKRLAALQCDCHQLIGQL